MPRIKTWRSALFAALDAHRGKPFEWGVHDCAILAADAVAAMTGEDLASPYRGLYASAAEATALLEGNGFADAVALAASRFEEPVGGNSVPIALQGVGGLALGVVTGAVVQVMGPRGLADVPLDAAVRAFRVG